MTQATEKKMEKKFVNTLGNAVVKTFMQEQSAEKIKSLIKDMETASAIAQKEILNKTSSEKVVNSEGKTVPNTYSEQMSTILNNLDLLLVRAETKKGLGDGINVMKSVAYNYLSFEHIGKFILKACSVETLHFAYRGLLIRSKMWDKESDNLDSMNKEEFINNITSFYIENSKNYNNLLKTTKQMTPAQKNKINELCEKYPKVTEYVQEVACDGMLNQYEATILIRKCTPRNATEKQLDTIDKLWKALNITGEHSNYTRENASEVIEILNKLELKQLDPNGKVMAMYPQEVAKMKSSIKLENSLSKLDDFFRNMSFE